MCVITYFRGAKGDNKPPNQLTDQLHVQCTDHARLSDWPIATLGRVPDRFDFVRVVWRSRGDGGRLAVLRECVARQKRAS